MKENQSYNVSIKSDADTTGDKAKNMELSQKRAESVKKYLEGKCIDPQRLFAHGYGETMPVANNSTAAGRAKNRRVEFKVVF